MAGISTISAVTVVDAGAPQAAPLQASASSILPAVHANGEGFGVRQGKARADRDLARSPLSPSSSPILPSAKGNSSSTVSSPDALIDGAVSSPALTGGVSAPVPTDAPPVPTLQEQAAQLVARQLAAAAAEKAAAKAAKQAAAAKAEAARLANIHRWVRPNYGSLSSPFGGRWGRIHEGIDLAGGYGSAILAATSGTVLYAGPESGYGEVLKIQDWDGTQTWYGHMSKFLVKAGDQVSPGEQVALVGARGDATGPHLHFEVRVNGTPIDPIPFLAARGIHI
ncbi:MAG: M23 family metallopeptidase [Acidothermaceae bacterium]